MPDNTHRCPAPKCTERVPDRLFACGPHWFALSKPVQAAIYATARKSLLDGDRWDAVQSAREEWALRHG